ncbi:nuclear envelope phosphatase-regulatory subunit 1 isoform X2 [Erinaceus europaeus]|uniref:Nuclear envelope phosphatase-regulatory subunit 1 isoform X2 n=1 Tax=Erinaceus europaeus TaxID=9365 RepID=A0ABM3WYC6_ERIEU|nr:nuclear envelope phosphatase-regulatory subunit 1 isoform X2 [Erinaceus europaeus]
MNSLEQAEDLKAFERRLTEYIHCLQPATGRWRTTRFQMPSRCRPGFPGLKTPPMCPGAPLPQRPTLLGKERGRLRVWTDQSTSMFSREAITEARPSTFCNPQ